MTVPSQVDNLLRDARLVCDYSAAVGSLKDDRLLLAINMVEKLDGEKRQMSSPEVVDLQKQYSESRSQVPFDVFYSLRNGWTIFPTRRRKWLVGTIVILAIFFMIAVLHLTRIYNRGVELSAGLTALETSESERRFGRLERDLLDASTRVPPRGAEAMSPAGTPADGTSGQPVAAGAADDDQFVLAREASHQMLYELVSLDQRIKNLNNLSAEFQEQARYPVVGMRGLENLFAKFQFWLGCKTGIAGGYSGCEVRTPNTQGGDAVSQAPPPGPNVTMAIAALAENSAAKPPAQEAQPKPPNPGPIGPIYDPRHAGMREIFCTKVGLLEGYASGSKPKLDDEMDYFIDRIAYSVGENFGVSAAMAIVQSCKLGLNYYSGSIPDIEAINMRVQDKLNLYSIIILPAMYGALGAIVFFMRPLLNPRLPNPGISQTIYRVALGALAGMILAWLGMGVFGSDEAFKSVGLGLFAFAFILGFSIDVFFELLDRLVGMSRGAVQRLGAPPSSAMAAGAQAAQPVANLPWQKS